MTVHQPYAVSVNGTLFSAISRQSVTPQSTVNSDVHAGSPYPQSVTINAQKATATATTRDLLVALGVLGSEGVTIGASGVKFFQLQLDPETGLPLSTASHRSLTIGRGIVVPTRITCQHQGDAELEFITHATWDPATPATHPLVPAGTVALPTGLAGDERWTIKDVTVENVALECNLNLSIDFGINVQTEGCNSDIWDRSVIIAEIKPVIRIRGKDLPKFLTGSIPLDGKGATHANTSINLRKRKTDAAGFSADDPIEFTAAGLAHWVNVHEGQGNNRLESELQIDCRHDGTNVPIVIVLPS